MPERPGEKTVDELFGLFRTSGRPKYLAEVFDRTAPELLRLATHMAQDPASAEDLLQNTFLRAIRDARRYEPGRRVLPWLIGILENVAREEKRRTGRRPEPERLNQTAAENPISAAAESEFTAAVDEAIEALPETYRPVLVLHLRHGMQPGEIAHALRRSPGTVRSQLARGLQRLRGILPAGFASMLALTLSPARGLAAVRAEVMAGAASLAPTVPLILVSTMTTKKLLVAVGIALASLVLFLTWSEAEAVDLGTDSEAQASTVMAQPVPESTAVPAEADEVDRSTISTVPTDPSAPANLVVKVKDAQGKPAEEIGVIIRPLDQADPLLAEEKQSTDHAGITRFAIQAAGLIEVRLDRSKGRRIQVQAGQTEQVELQLSGHEVQGLVKDPMGAPIADAWIWVSPGGLADEAVLAVRSDADGQFVL
ncbi:MAG: RNA polymerase sigma factor, partial [Planctomycetota bacterium]